MATVSTIRPPITPREAPTTTAHEWRGEEKEKSSVSMCFIVTQSPTTYRDMMNGGCVLVLAYVCTN